jgi:hypothetical protein
MELDAIKLPPKLKLFLRNSGIIIPAICNNTCER